MNNRTIRTAMMKRVPEVYFMSKPLPSPDKVYWALLVRIKGRPYKMVCDMPKTAIVSHKELLNTMVSEVYDEVQKIKSGKRIPPIVPGEELLPPLTKEDLKAMDYSTIEDMASDRADLAINDGLASLCDAPELNMEKVEKKSGIILP